MSTKLTMPIVFRDGIHRKGWVAVDLCAAEAFRDTGVVAPLALLNGAGGGRTVVWWGVPDWAAEIGPYDVRRLEEAKKNPAARCAIRAELILRKSKEE